MPVLTDLIDALRTGRVQVVDLTAPLHSGTPILQLPPPFANASPFGLTEISHYDERGPAWYWNDIHTSEHTGTHFDAPVHWVTGQDGEDMARVPPARLVAPAAVLDFSAESDPDFLLEVEHIRAWEAEHGPLPDGGWLLYRTGWDARSEDAAAFLNANETGPHTPGISVECARWLAEESPVLGVGVETVGTDAGAAHSFDPPFPCHSFLLGAGKYGLTQLQNLARLPATGAVVIAGPLPIVNGSGSPARVLALVEPVSASRESTAPHSRRSPSWSGGRWRELGVGHAFGVVGSGNFHVTNALRAAGVPYLAARHEGGAATMADAYTRTSGRVGVLTVHQGCGLTNAMTGITEAAKSRTPMLVLAADTGAAAVRSNFRIDQSGLVGAVGAVAERVHTPGSARGRRRAGVPDRGRAAPHRGAQPAAGRAGRRGARPGSGARAALRSARCGRPPAAVRALAALIAAAERPVFVAGRGARGARAELRALAAASGALLATSAVANGLFHGDEWSLGISGGFATPLAAELITDADLVVGWGCTLNMWTMRHGALIGPAARVVQVDLDADAIGANRPVDLGVLGDVAATAADVLAALRPARGPATARTRCGPRSPPAAAGATSRSTTSPAPTASTRARCPARWTSCCPPSARWPSTPATSWATRPPTCGCRTSTGSASPRASSPSGSAWPPRSAPRWPARTGWRWPRSATAGR